MSDNNGWTKTQGDAPRNVDPDHLINWFDDFEGENDFAFLSNFYVARTGFEMDPKEVLHPNALKHRAGLRMIAPTTEHLYQAAKGQTARDVSSVLMAATPGRSKTRGRTIQCRADWETVKVDVMRACLKAKFAEGSGLAQQLLNTCDATLVEGTTWGDTVWGVDLLRPWQEVHTWGWPGENKLGVLLMERREELRT